MSQSYRKYSVKYIVKAGSREVLSFSCKKNDGSTQDFTDATVYAVARLKVWKPDGTLLINNTADFDSDRSTGLVTYDLASGDATNAKAGNWEGEIEVVDTGALITYQTGTFGFTIEESY